MKLSLQSTFRDYYDPWFDRDGGAATFERIGGNVGPPKRDQFRILEEAGFLTPPHGLVEDVLDYWWDAEGRWIREVVVYTDENAHCAEGKTVFRRGGPETRTESVMGRSEHNDQVYKNLKLYCSAYVGEYLQNRIHGATSLRRLQIGRKAFWIEYRSFGSWMSNDGDGTCEVVGQEEGYHPVVKRPLWAADFVIGREMYAVDFNTAPGVRGSGVEKILPGDEAVRLIKEAHEEFKL